MRPARWLATDETDLLSRALAVWANVASTDKLLELIRDLPLVKDRVV